MIEMILLEINNKLKEEKIDKKKVKNYSDIYSLSLENLEEILKLDWVNESVLSSIIRVYSSDKEVEEKIKLIKLILRNLDKKDEVKISSSLKVVEHLEEFKEDYVSSQKIVSNIMSSMCDKGAKVASDTAIKLLEDLNEEDYDTMFMNVGRTRISEIVGFITREEDENKIDEAKELLKTKLTGKLGVICYMVAVLMECENEKQVSTVVDVAKSENSISNHSKLVFASIASRSSDENLEKIYDLLGYAGYLTEEEISCELEELISSNSSERAIARKITK